MSYRVRYCLETLRYFGVCNLHPLYRAYGDSAEEAMQAIIALVAGLDRDNEPTDVDLPIGLDDTTEVTNTHWPPFAELL